MIYTLIHNVNYHRLKEVDTRGSVKKQNSISNYACVPEQTTIAIINTTDGKAFMNFNASEPDNFTVKLFDLVNKCVFNETIEVQKGFQRFELITTICPWPFI